MSSHQEIEILLFILVSLLIGGLTREINKYTKVPYTPLLLVIGIVWGSLDEYLGTLGESAAHVSNINPHMILLIFLPALVYESSSSTDWHTFRRLLGQVMMLAFLGVLISAFLTASSLLYILDYSDVLSWGDALLLGSILSATDPVAVVALLKEVGASKKLATLIEGESLLNDGTAMVLFTVILEIAKGNDVGVDYVAFSFMRMSFGGTLLGLIAGGAMVFWIKRVFNDSVLEVMITFFSVYLVFFIAESTALHVSGILALVALGLYMAASGKTSIDIHSETVVHNFWRMLGFIGETLIFLLSGIIIGDKVIRENHIELMDWVKLLLLFLLLTIIRSFAVLVSYPILAKYAYGFTWQEGVILVHGGLRGAVGLTLALIVNREEADIDSDVRNLTLFHTAGIATITLLINATTTGYLISKLGLAKVSKTQTNLLQQVSQTVNDETLSTIQELRAHKYLKFADWGKVKEFSQLSEVKNTQRAKLVNLNQLIMSQDPVEMQCEIRHRFLCMLKGMYWDEYEKGQCSPGTALSLIESADVCLDVEEEPMRDWEFLERSLLGIFSKILIKGKNLPLIGRFFTLLLYKNFAFAYDASCAFIAAHNAAEETIQDILNESNADYLSMILAESNRQTELCNDFVTYNISDVFSEIYRDIQTKKATYEVLHRQKRLIDEFHKLGFIDEKEFSELNGKVLYNMHCLNRKSMYSKMPVLEDLLSKIEFFEVFQNNELKGIIDKSEKRIFSRGEFLFKAKAATDGVFILLRGKVCEYNEYFSYDHTAGSIIGIQNLLNHIDENLTSSKAKSAVYTAYLKKEHFPDYEHMPRIEEKLWQLASPLLVKLDPAPFMSILSTMDYDRLKKLLAFCTYAKYHLGDRITVETGGLLVSGEVNKLLAELGSGDNDAVTKLQKINSRKNIRANTLRMAKIKALHFIEPDYSHSYFATTDIVVILHLCDELFEAWTDRRNSIVQAVDQVAYKQQNSLNLNCMDSFSRATINRIPRMSGRNDFFSVKQTKPSIFSEGLKQLEKKDSSFEMSESRGLISSRINDNMMIVSSDDSSSEAISSSDNASD